MASVSASELYGTHFSHVQKANEVEATTSLPTSSPHSTRRDALPGREPPHPMSFGYAYLPLGQIRHLILLIIWNADTQDTFEMILSAPGRDARSILDFINASWQARSRCAACSQRLRVSGCRTKRTHTANATPHISEPGHAPLPACVVAVMSSPTLAPLAVPLPSRHCTTRLLLPCPAVRPAGRWRIRFMHV